MARYQERTIHLTKKRQKLELKIWHGHVYRKPGRVGSMEATVLYDEQKEQRQLDELLADAIANGFKVVTDTGLVAAKSAKKPSGMSAKTWRWIQQADEAVRMWRDDEYDNHKDAILDVRSLLEKQPDDQSARVRRLEQVLATATKQLAQLAAEDPQVARYARGLLQPSKPTKRSAKKTASRSRER